MLLKELYKNLDALVNADGTDDYFGIDDFNRIIPSEQLSILSDVVDEEKNRSNINRPMTDQMLAATTEAAAADTYFWEVPIDLIRVESMVYIDTSGIKKSVDFIQSAEFVRRLGDLTAPPIAENPCCYVETGDELHVKPTYDVGRWFLTFPKLTTGTYGLFYTKEPITPFLDWYTDTNGDIQYIAYNYDLSLITTGTYRDGTDMSTQTGTSSTYELEIPEEFHTRLMERFVERYGLKDRDQLSTNYGMAKDAQDANK